MVQAPFWKLKGRAAEAIVEMEPPIPVSILGEMGGTEGKEVGVGG
jgi:hypothetical protein